MKTNVRLPRDKTKSKPPTGTGEQKRNSPLSRKWLPVLGGVMVVMIGALFFILNKNLAGDVTLSPTQAVVNTLIPLTTPPIRTKTPDLIPTQTMTLIPSPTLIPTMIGGGSGKLAFISNRDGNQEIHLIDADGGNLENLTNSTEDESQPALSPDGNRVAYVVDNDILTMELSEKNQAGNIRTIQDSDGSKNYLAPAWKESQVVFVAVPFTNKLRYVNCVIKKLSSDGSIRHECLDTLTGRTTWVDPRDLNEEVETYPSDYGVVPYIGQRVDLGVFPGKNFSFSPDGKKVALINYEDIWIYETDSSNIINLTNTGKIIKIHVDWSPDGMQIAFASHGTGNYEIYVMNADGSNIRQITDSPSDDIYPTWSPDGRMLAFATNRDGNWEIYMMNADGSNQTNLTNNPANDTQPDWGP
jgi:Tol biopolymer transport system component